jgi:hypothetical protein
VQCRQLFNTELNFLAQIGIFDADPVMPAFDDFGSAADIADIYVGSMVCLTALVRGQQQTP